jgi:DNA-binding NtrC family response regulator
VSRVTQAVFRAASIAVERDTIRSRMSENDRYGDEFPTGALRAHEGAGTLVLRVLASDHVEHHNLPPTGEVVIGRGEKVAIAIDDPSVSRRHAVLTIGRTITVTDQGSRHGTKVGGRRLAANESAAVALGEAIDLGAVLVVINRLVKREAADARKPIVSDPAMVELHRLVDKFAAGNISVMLLGETGVGKEVTAELVHARSPRAAKPLLRLNCAALTETLLESELFGHEKGAFTGAVQSKPGLFETAQGGTVFLDEIGEMPMTTQVKLLRVIEERRVTRVGGTKSFAIDVRFIAATHRDLQGEIAAGRFRQDLYFRLNGVTLRIPPLRERPSEIEPLAQAFVAEFAAQSGHAVPTISPTLVAHLKTYSWPGNIRELRNLTERAVLLAAGEPLTMAHFPLEEPAASKRASMPPAADSLDETAAGRTRPGELWTELQAIERQRIVDALNAAGGNQTRAAKILGISRNTLSTRLGEYGLPRPRSKNRDDD